VQNRVMLPMMYLEVLRAMAEEARRRGRKYVLISAYPGMVWAANGKRWLKVGVSDNREAAEKLAMGLEVSTSADEETCPAMEMERMRDEPREGFEEREPGEERQG